jgi:Carboxypeptidase regulatory-like domain
MPRSVCRLFVILAAVLAAAGCGGGSGTVLVRGVVKLDGQPVANASVVFVAQTPGGRDAYGSTNANGEFRLTTTNPDDGALPGKYKVVIQSAGEDGGSTPFDDTGKLPAARPKAPRGPRVPAKYTSVGQTPLTQEVPPSGEVVFDLQSK